MRKLGIYAHEKLGVCNRGICETSGCIRGNFGVFFVVWVWCVRCLPFLPFQCVQPFRHSCILGAFVGAKELKEAHYLRYVHIFRFGVGGSWFDDVGRSGGLPTEGLRGNPLTIP